MTPGQWLWLLVLVLYGSECCFWVVRSALVCWPGRRQRAGGDGGIGNPHGRLVWLNPLGSSGRAVVCGRWGWALASGGVSQVAGEVANPGRRDGATRSFTWDEIGLFRSKGAAVYADSALLVRAPSVGAARDLVDLLAGVRRAPEAEREALVQAAVAASLDADAAGERWGKFDADAGWARFWCGQVALAMLLLVPVVYWRFGDSVEVLVAVGVLLLMTWMAAWRCFALHRRWFPERRAERWQQLLISMLAPTHAARGVDAVSRDVLAGFHPLAVSSGGEVAADGLAAAAVRDAWHPVAGEDEVARAFRETHWKPALRSYIEGRGGEVDTLLRGPASPVVGGVTYCPRCLEEYGEGRDDCADCDGVALVRFGGQ